MIEKNCASSTKLKIYRLPIFFNMFNFIEKLSVFYNEKFSTSYLLFIYLFL